MDSFTTIFFTSPAPIEVPSDEENKTAQGGGTYCVIFAKDPATQLPVDEENKTAQGGGTYCTIA
jgi:hypothetical protein